MQSVSACRRVSVRSAPAGPQLARSRVVVKAAAPAHEATKQRSYYVVQNVFSVKPEFGPDFEEVWRQRESRLKDMPGFIRFAMLRCDNIPGKYISQTFWATKDDFKAWASSPQFKASHGGSDGKGGQHGHGQAQAQPEAPKKPSMMEMLNGPPSPEMYESVTVTE